MRLLLLVTVILSFHVGGALYAEDHQGRASSGLSRPDSSVRPGSKLFEYLSACMAGRPFGGSDVGALSLTPPGSPGSATSSTLTGVSNGERVFRTTCLSCHSGSSGPPNLTVLNSTSAQKSIGQVQSGAMPKGRSISASEKADLIKYLESKR